MYDKTAAKASRQDKSPDPTTAESDEMEDSKDTGASFPSPDFLHAGAGVLLFAAMIQPVFSRRRFFLVPFRLNVRMCVLTQHLGNHL